MNEMIEKVARALSAAEDGNEENWRSFTPDARAAISAMREPTEAMANAGGLAINADEDVLAVTAQEARQAFTAMLDAALGDAP
jgi:hypothetical protein